MEYIDYGQFARQMRKSRGLTQTNAAKAAGVSFSTIYNLETSDDQITIRASSLDAILTAYAMHAYLNVAEIKAIAAGANRSYESLERINTRAEYLKTEQSGDLRTRPAPNVEPSRQQRIISAFQVIEAAGDGEMALTVIEAIAEKAAAKISAENRTPKHTPPGER